MRFAVAKQNGLDEARVDRIDDQWPTSDLSDRQKAALAYTDAFLDATGPMSADVAERFRAEFAADERTELAIGLALFNGFSKVLIALGCEPTEMAVTEFRTPGS